MLNLEKIDFRNYCAKEVVIPQFDKKRKNESELIEYDNQNIRQNIIRSWEFLKKTHILKSNECCCVRAVTYKLFSDDMGAGSHEHIIYDFDEKGFENYYKFIVSHILYKRVYNFYFNIYKINRTAGKERIKEREGGFMASSSTTSSTNILSLDFDHITHNEYLKLKEDLYNRGLQTLDVFSGHGYHIHFLIEDVEDVDVLKKMIKVFQSLGYNPDIACKDSGRVLRIPFLYNDKPEYDTATLCEVIDGEYSCCRYSVNEVFENLGYDYETYSIEEERKKSTGRPKKENTEENNKKKVQFDINTDFDKLYKIDVKKLPNGIANMLKGFQKGYTNLQTFILTLYFKNRGFSIDEIVSLLKVTQSINGNDWNNWNIEKEVERIYNNYSYANKFILEELEEVFGTFNIEYKKIPVGLDPKQTKLFIFLLLNGECKKKDIIKGLSISNNKIDRIMENNNLVKLENRIYRINETEFDKFVLVDIDELEKLNSLDYKEIAVYTYLKWRTGIKKYIKISIQKIKENTNISEKTITNTISSLEKKGILKVKRFKYCEHDEAEFYKEYNEYTIL